MKAKPLVLEVLLLLSVCSALTAAATYAFPTMDDGYLSLIIRERGAAGVVAGHPDRPLVGLLLSLAVDVFHDRFWQVAFLVNGVVWFWLGLQASFLWRLLFPLARQYAVIPGLLVICPVVAQIQLSTVTTTVFDVLPVVLAYSGFFALVRAVRNRSWGALIVGLLLGAAGTLLSEYGVSAASVVVVVLFFGAWEAETTKRRQLRQTAIALGVVVGLAYLVFVLTSHMESRSDVDPRVHLKTLAWLVSFLPSLASRIWHVFLAAYGAAAGRIWMALDTRSSIAIVFCGGALALVATIMTRFGESDRPNELVEGGALRWLSLAVVTGLTPIAATRQFLDEPFMTRFNVPVLPAAVVVTTCGALLMVRRRYRTVAIALLVFVAGASLCAVTVDAIRRQRQMTSIGAQLKPFLGAEGLTVAVLPAYRLCGGSYACTASATVEWPVDVEKRVWFVDGKTADRWFGKRSHCKKEMAINESVRGVKRLGSVETLLWIEESGNGFEVQPYCCVAQVGRQLGTAVIGVQSVK
jgi:hypothetical protein